MNTNDPSKKSWIEEFYRDLNTLVDTAFPKTCPMCRKVYQNSYDFLTQTTPVKDAKLQDHSGLFSLEGAYNVAAIGVFRNCACGTTLMADFHDRRDGSQKGHERRERFSAMVQTLSGHGMNENQAKKELRHALRGQQSTKMNDWLQKDIISENVLETGTS